MSAPEKRPLFLLVIRNPPNPPQPSPEEMQKIFEQWMSWLKGLKAKGQYLSGHPLDDQGKVLRGPRGATVTDGPFAEAKEIVGGYMIMAADSLDQAAAIAQGCPGFQRGASIEIRPIDLLPDM